MSATNLNIHAALVELASLRNLATPGDWEARRDDGGDAIGIQVSELLWDGPVTPEMAEKGIDQQIIGEEVTIVANMAWDEAGNELGRIDANINYICALHRFVPRVPALVSKLVAAEAKIRELTEQLTPGSLTERAPTQWAYEQACAALEKHRQRADAAEVQVVKVYEVIDKEFDQYHRDGKSNCTPQQAQFYATCEGAIAMLRLHLEKEVPEPTAT